MSDQNSPLDPDLYQRVMESGAMHASGSGVAPSMGIPHGLPPARLGALGAAQGGALATGHGVTVTMPGFGGHLLTVGLAAATGASVGALAAQSARGAAIGASTQLGYVGLVNAAFGRQFVGTAGRVGYGLLGAAGFAMAIALAVRGTRR